MAKFQDLVYCLTVHAVSEVSQYVNLNHGILVLKIVEDTTFCTRDVL